MSDSATKKRPQFRNINVLQLLKYRLPLAGRLSILHRVSGALMFLLLPVLILPLFAMSMSPTGFEAF
ncbi:MAG TPA: succinate dehydrogenase, cytochrome b556 subunit, partial [Orrella sp.]